jgi:CheY-like chemotaxis protein
LKVIHRLPLKLNLVCGRVMVPEVMTILCVDDDQDELDLFCDAIREINRSVTCIPALDGEQALKILKILIPDIIFLDVNMPRMGGKECLIEIKKDPLLKDIPVIIYSTSANPIEVQTFYALGVQRYLMKQTNYKTLCTELRDVLETSHI